MNTTKDDDSMEVDVEMGNATEPSASTSKLNLSSGVMASSNIVPSVTVSLHPLVIMNISEHWTRIRAQEGSRQQGLIGFFSGKFFILIEIFY